LWCDKNNNSYTKINNEAGHLDAVNFTLDSLTRLTLRVGTRAGDPEYFKNWNGAGAGIN